MKFDFVIGNPPYQEENKDNNRKGTVYDKFMQEAYKVGTCVELITKAAFLSGATKSSQKLNDKVQNDKHFHILERIEDAKSVFPNTIIKSGLAITIRNENKIYDKTGADDVQERVIRKINDICELDRNNFTQIVSGQGLYHFSDIAFKEHPEILKISASGTGSKITSKVFGLATDVFIDTPVSDDEYQRILGVINQKRITKYILKKYLKQVDNINYYNVAFPQANGRGVLGEKLTNSEILDIGCGTTDTFLNIGSFDTKNEAENVIKYIKCKFFRVLLGKYKTTQNTNNTVWRAIPLQDFTANSDIDWSVSIAEIDKQLYRKYGLKEEEISFIEENIKEMI